MAGRDRTETESGRVGAEEDRHKQDHEPYKPGLAHHRITSLGCLCPGPRYLTYYTASESIRFRSLREAAKEAWYEFAG
jgi:hypothetical protein